MYKYKVYYMYICLYDDLRVHVHVHAHVNNAVSHV